MVVYALNGVESYKNSKIALMTLMLCTSWDHNHWINSKQKIKHMARTLCSKDKIQSRKKKKRSAVKESNRIIFVWLKCA